MSSRYKKTLQIILSNRCPTARRTCTNVMACHCDPVNAPLPICYHPEFSRSTATGVGIIIIGERLGPALRMRGVAGPKNTPLPNVCYHAKFVRSRSNGTNIITAIH